MNNNNAVVSNKGCTFKVNIFFVVVLFGICFHMKKTGGIRHPCSANVHANVVSLMLTLKAPNKNCSGCHFNFLLLSVEENNS